MKKAWITTCIHPDTKAMLEYLLVMLSVKGEEYTYSYIKKEV